MNALNNITNNLFIVLKNRAFGFFNRKMYYLCTYNELPRKHIKAEYSNKNGLQIVTSKTGNSLKVLCMRY